jgi:hypothetical protein
MKRLIETHADGTQVWWESDDEGNFQIYTISDVTPILEENQRKQDDPDYSKNGIKNNMWHYATIPCDVLAHWHHEGIIDLNYPLTPRETDNTLHKLRRKYLEHTKQWDKIAEMDKRQEMAARNKEALVRKLNDPDYARLKTVRGRV